MTIRRLFVFSLAVCLVSGCSSESEQADGRLSDAELLKLNQQCREAADKKVKDETTSYGNIYQGTSIVSVKYSQTYRRCLGRFSQIQSTGDNHAFSSSVTDPISNDDFAIQISASEFFTREESCTIFSSLTESRSGEPYRNVGVQECAEFMYNVMAEP